MIPNRASEVEAFHKTIFHKDQNQKTNSNFGESLLADDELIQKILASRQAEKFKTLFIDGNISEYENDDSKADYALVSILGFWTRKDPKATDRIFRRSALMREKWERDDYRERTITRAFNNLKEVWNGGYGQQTSTPNLDDVLDEKEALINDLVCTVGEFLRKPIKAKNPLIETLLFKPSLVEVFSWRGRGKTFFGMAMAKAMATCEDFLGRYLVTRSCHSLYIDGEMADADSFERFQKFMADSPEALDRCHYLSSEATFQKLGRGLNFNHKQDQDLLLSILKNMESKGSTPDVLFFDNLSCLCPTEENSNTEQEAYLVFFRNLRHLGYVVIFFHHAGLAGNARGASRREDFCDLCIELAEHPQAKDGVCMFQLQFTKTRSRAPRPFRLLCELSEDLNGSPFWITSIPEGKSKTMEKWVTYLKWIADNHPTLQAEIAKAHGVSSSAVSQQLDVLRAKDFLSGLTVTQQGSDFLKARFSHA